MHWYLRKRRLGSRQRRAIYLLLAANLIFRHWMAFKTGRITAVIWHLGVRARYDAEEEMRNAQKKRHESSMARTNVDTQSYPFEQSRRRHWREGWTSSPSGRSEPGRPGRLKSSSDFSNLRSVASPLKNLGLVNACGFLQQRLFCFLFYFLFFWFFWQEKENMIACCDLYVLFTADL
ncbi:TPR repeat-containing thioredoxin TTL1-like [Senna tora]|uniref:TPR repeat-containing thioredoxin TTL1-like n=1 Tax=Senna tora TaxID=362788 RepID=A0A834TT78_9FABA|nr:TPR repeat-containing thioredoxin TTL1-like [Senna tora]